MNFSLRTRKQRHETFPFAFTSQNLVSYSYGLTDWILIFKKLLLSLYFSPVCLPAIPSHLFLNHSHVSPNSQVDGLFYYFVMSVCVIHTHTHTHLYNLLNLFLLFAWTWTIIKEAHPWERLSLGRDSQTLDACKSLSTCGVPWHFHASMLTYSLLLPCSGLFHTVISSRHIAQPTSWYSGSYDLPRPSSHSISEQGLWCRCIHQGWVPHNYWWGYFVSGCASLHCLHLLSRAASWLRAGSDTYPEKVAHAAWLNFCGKDKYHIHNKKYMRGGNLRTLASSSMLDQ